MNPYFNNYQKFTRTTAVYPEALSLPYLALGLCDEAGELLEKVVEFSHAHEHSSNYNPAQRKDILAEAGDVCWYATRIADHLDLPLSELATKLLYDGHASLERTSSWISIRSAVIAGRCKKILRDGDTWSPEQHAKAKATIEACLTEVFAGIEALSRAFGMPLVGVLLANEEKLSDRLERDVIKGDGDNR